jgi:hypothetical protein
MWGTLSDEGQVCHLQLMLALNSAVILGSESHVTHDHIYCLRFETSPTWRARSPIYIPQEQGGPRHWVPFPPPPTIRRATVEVLEPSSTQASSLKVQLTGPPCIASAQTMQKAPLPIIPLMLHQSLLMWKRVCLTMAISSCLTIPAFSCHVTICVHAYRVSRLKVSKIK